MNVDIEYLLNNDEPLVSPNASEYQELINDMENALPEAREHEVLNDAESLATQHSQDNGTIAAEYYDCGIRHALNHFEPAISYGIKTSRSEFPWHVALYRQNSSDERPEYICGGSIIHPRVILTGEMVNTFKRKWTHLHLPPIAATIPGPARMYLVFAWLIVMPIASADLPSLRNASISIVPEVVNIKFPKTYVGILNRYADDVALLELNSEIKFNSAIMPICIDWSSEYLVEQLPTAGTVVGWGATENSTISNELLMANLKFIEFTKCRDRSSINFSYFITSDKFCAGLENGTAVQRGDSGGGITFPRHTTSHKVQYYLYGIVSIREIYKGNIAGFTDIRKHLPWLNLTLLSITNPGLLRVDLNVTCKFENLTGICKSKDSCFMNSSTIKLEPCYKGDISFVCCPPEEIPFPNNPIQTDKNVTSNRPRRIPGEKAKEMCKIYGETAYRRVKNPTSNGPPVFETLDCPVVETQIKGGANALEREFPHMVQIAKFKKGKWVVMCSGTIVSPEFILSAAHCNVTKENALVISGTNRLATPAEINSINFLNGHITPISDVFIHPNFNEKKMTSDVALYKLSASLSQDERPVCLHTGSILDNMEAIAAGFGVDEYSEPFDVLQKVTVNVVDKGPCGGKFKQIASG
ncbi:transmembrane protease serine 9 [Halyomorpha halys]|uniref:transmembrane protease serine 9 n=1 Tax=Halyomorpha halys TaxID=286706 RepID=UPI0034D2FF9E